MAQIFWQTSEAHRFTVSGFSVGMAQCLHVTILNLIMTLRILNANCESIAGKSSQSMMTVSIYDFSGGELWHSWEY